MTNKQAKNLWPRVTRYKTREYDEGKFLYSRPLLRCRLVNDALSYIDENPPPVNSNTHLFLGHFAVRRASLMSDAYSLLSTFIQYQSFDFRAFKKAWIEKKFSLIHCICPRRSLRDRFMFALYQTFFSFLYGEASEKFPLENIELHLKLGVFFSLYMLYCTQPVFVTPSLIMIDAGQWEVLNQLYQHFGDNKLTDGVYVFGKLKEMKAFGFVAHVEHRPFYYQQVRLGFGGFQSDLTKEPQQQSTDQPNISQFQLLEERLKDLEAAVASTQLGGFADPEILEELKDIETNYELSKQSLVSEDIAPGINTHFSSAVTDPHFQEWAVTRGEEDTPLTTSMYFDNIVRSYLDFKKTKLKSPNQEVEPSFDLAEDIFATVGENSNLPIQGIEPGFNLASDMFTTTEDNLNFISQNVDPGINLAADNPFATTEENFDFINSILGFEGQDFSNFDQTETDSLQPEPR